MRHVDVFHNRLRRIAVIAALPILAASSAAMAALHDATPVTDEIYMVWYRESSPRQHDVPTLTNPASYTVSSTDDAEFSGGKSPTEIGRKSKAFLPPANVDSAGAPKEHWLFLVLPHKLKRGKTYTITDGALLNETFTYSEFTERSEAIHVNHFGYPPKSTVKFAYISIFMGDLGGLELEPYEGAQFHVVKDGESEPLFTGTINKRKDYETDLGDTWNFRGTELRHSYTACDVWECDFTHFTGEPGYNGKYRVAVEGLGCSYPFRIDNDVYHNAWVLAMNGLEWHRDLDDAKLYDVVTSNEAEVLGEKTGEQKMVRGGYRDAADCDKNSGHLNVAKELLWVYEMRPEIFSDGQLDIPEKNNGVPDIIDEAAWVIAYFMRTQANDGGIHDGSGPAGCSAPDHGFNALYGINPHASLAYSMRANQLAYCMQLAEVTEITGPYYDDVDLTVTNLLASAKKAYEYGLANIADLAGDAACNAHGWMYKVTGDAQYQDAFKQASPIQPPFDPATDSLHGMYGDVIYTADGITKDRNNAEIPFNMEEAAMIYLTTDHANKDAEFNNVLKQGFDIWFTNDRIWSSQQRGMRWAHHWRQPTIVGATTTPDVLPQAIAYYKIFPGEKRWLDIIYPSLDWVLGGNNMNMCWMHKAGYRYPVSHAFISNQNNVGAGVGIYGAQFLTTVRRTNSNSPSTNFEWITMYPVFRLWGEAETWCENKFHGITNEWTVHQVQNRLAAAFALMRDGGPADALGVERKIGAANAVLPLPSLTRASQNVLVRFDNPNAGMRKVSLVSIGGRRVFSYTGTASQVSVPLRSLAPGCYFLRVNDGIRRTFHQVSVVR